MKYRISIQNEDGTGCNLELKPELHEWAEMHFRPFDDADPVRRVRSITIIRIEGEKHENGQD